MKKYIVFSINKGEACLDLEFVLEASKIAKFRVAPGSKNFIKGMMDYRGNLIPIIDINSNEVKNSLIIIKYNDTVFGFAVDSIIGIDLRDIQDLVQETEHPFFLKASDVSIINVAKITESIS